MLLTLRVGLMVHQYLSGNRDLQLAVQWSENLGMSIVRVIALTLLKAQFSSGLSLYLLHVIAVGRVLKGSCIACIHLCTITLFVCCPSNYSSVMKKFTIFVFDEGERNPNFGSWYSGSKQPGYMYFEIYLHVH